MSRALMYGRLDSVTDSRSAKPFGPKGEGSAVRKIIPIRREQISQSELASLLDAASRDMQWFSAGFAWRDGSQSTLYQDDLLSNHQQTPGDRVRRFHQLEELSGVVTQGSFGDGSSLSLFLGEFRDTSAQIWTLAQAESSQAQERAYELRTLVETFTGAVRLPGKRRVNRAGLVLTVAVVLVIIAFTLFVTSRGLSWLAIVPPILSVLASYYLVRHVLFTQPARPFVVHHPSSSRRVRGQRVPDWLQVGFAGLSLALMIWMLYLVYRPPG